MDALEPCLAEPARTTTSGACTCSSAAKGLSKLPLVSRCTTALLGQGHLCQHRQKCATDWPPCWPGSNLSSPPLGQISSEPLPTPPTPCPPTMRRPALPLVGAARHQTPEQQPRSTTRLWGFDIVCRPEPPAFALAHGTTRANVCSRGLVEQSGTLTATPLSPL